jgi:histidine triad (HIT) family protein
MGFWHGRKYSVSMKGRPPTRESAKDTKGCAFCQIARREQEASIVFEDDISLAFLDHRPLFPGHCLLITKAHLQTLADLPLELVGPIFLNAQLLAKAIQEAMKAEGTFVAVNNVVSQSVPHFHIHIVPRRKGDGLRGFFWPRGKYETREAMTAVQRALESAVP